METKRGKYQSRAQIFLKTTEISSYQCTKPTQERCFGNHRSLIPQNLCSSKHTKERFFSGLLMLLQLSVVPIMNLLWVCPSSPTSRRRVLILSRKATKRFYPPPPFSWKFLALALFSLLLIFNKEVRSH